MQKHYPIISLRNTIVSFDFLFHKTTKLHFLTHCSPVLQWKHFVCWMQLKLNFFSSSWIGKDSRILANLFSGYCRKVLIVFRLQDLNLQDCTEAETEQQGHPLPLGTSTAAVAAAIQEPRGQCPFQGPPPLLDPANHWTCPQLLFQTGANLSSNHTLICSSVHLKLPWIGRNQVFTHWLRLMMTLASFMSRIPATVLWGSIMA